MNKEQLIREAKQFQKRINQAKELADLSVFLTENEKKIIEITSVFFDLFAEVGKEGNDETQKLRQFTFLFSYLMILIKSSGMPKEIKQELINHLNFALEHGKI